MRISESTKNRPQSFAAPTAPRLFPPPALSRVERSHRQPIVHRTEADQAFLEGYDAARAYPSAGAAIVQGVADALAAPGAPALFIVASIGADGTLVAHATTDPAAFIPSRTQRPRIRRTAERIAA